MSAATFKRDKKRKGVKDINILITEAHEGDIEHCIKICLEAYTKIHEVYTELMTEELHGAFRGDWRERIRLAVTTQIGNGIKDNRAFVAKDNGMVVGFISYTVDEKKNAQLCYNAVDGRYRGKGIGGRLYERAFDSMRGEGIGYVMVITGGDEGHAPARRAYEKAGFRHNLPSVTYFKKL